MKLGARPLWWRIWLAVLASIVAFALLAGSAWRMYSESVRESASPEVIAATLAEQLPPRTAPRERQIAALVRLQHRHNLDLALFDPERRLLAYAGLPVPPPHADETESHWLLPRRPPAAGPPRERLRGPAYAFRLPDAHWLVVRRGLPNARPLPFGLIGMLAVMAVAVGVGAYPVVRRLTRRLERLQASVDQLGAGDLSTRVVVEGQDEVARLAERFNAAAARIEALVNAQKNLLANASHEFRSPLARIRMAVEMLGERPRPELLAEVRTNVAELDALVEEILIASRLDAASALPPLEDVDLTALAAEECARTGASLEAKPVVVRGDARLLRRLIRNLLENAGRHGAGTPIDVQLKCVDASAVLDVCDRGPGIPENERERIFEPFYRAAGARERDGSVGLGLALVRQIAVRHGGSVACRPRAGGGAWFEVRLPLGTGT